MLLEAVSEHQHAQAKRSRARTIGASAVAGVMWLAALLPLLIPQLTPLLPPKAQSALKVVAGLLTTIAAFLAKDSGASAIPVAPDPPDPTVPPEGGS